MALEVKNLSANAGDMRLVFDPWVRKIDPLEKGMATYSSIKGSGRLLVGSQRVRHN